MTTDERQPGEGEITYKLRYLATWFRERAASNQVISPAECDNIADMLDPLLAEVAKLEKKSPPLWRVRTCRRPVKPAGLVPAWRGWILTKAGGTASRLGAPPASREPGSVEPASLSEEGNTRSLIQRRESLRGALRIKTTQTLP